jgi:hypothetical protein
MPTPPPDRSRRSLNHGQRMFLLYGPADQWADAFADEREVREAWEQHRARILGHYRRGRRPWGWWQFEAGELRYPGYDREQAVLFEAGLLAPEERAELVTDWRREFERAQAADFWICLGPGRSLKGAPARRQHYKWADVPRELLLRWTRERRRQGKAIRQLEETVAGNPAPTA